MPAITNIPASAPSTAVGQTNASASALRDIKPPIEIPNAWIWVMWIAGSLALAVALLWMYRHWRNRRLSLLYQPPTPPHIRARKELEEALGLIEQPNPFCTMVSGIVRRYLEERFTFHAPERTTEEFLHELRSTNLLTPDQKDSLGEFLQQCDLVKFARYEPAQSELKSLHGSAVRLVEETEPQPVAELANTAA
jgi:hypothetical protein